MPSGALSSVNNANLGRQIERPNASYRTSRFKEEISTSSKSQVQPREEANQQQIANKESTVNEPRRLGEDRLLDETAIPIDKQFLGLHPNLKGNGPAITDPGSSRTTPSEASPHKIEWQPMPKPRLPNKKSQRTSTKQGTKPARFARRKNMLDQRAAAWNEAFGPDEGKSLLERADALPRNDPQFHNSIDRTIAADTSTASGEPHLADLTVDNITVPPLLDVGGCSVEQTVARMKEYRHILSEAYLASSKLDNSISKVNTEDDNCMKSLIDKLDSSLLDQFRKDLINRIYARSFVRHYDDWADLNAEMPDILLQLARNDAKRRCKGMPERGGNVKYPEWHGALVVFCQRETRALAKAYQERVYKKVTQGECGLEEARQIVLAEHTCKNIYYYQNPSIEPQAQQQARTKAVPDRK